MLASALPFSSMLACVHTTARRRLVAISLWLSVFAVSSPGLAHALPSQTDEAAVLKARAEALGAEGRNAESAETYERFADKTTDDTQRLIGYLHATLAWRAAYASSGKTHEHCSAKAVLRRAVADETIAARGRDEFRTLLEKLEAEGINCQPTVALLDPLGDSPARRDTLAACGDAPACDAAPACDVPTCDAVPAPPIEAHAVSSSGAPTADAPQRSPLSIAGTSMLALAVPALGGTVYALIADRAIIREVDELTTYEPDHTDRLEDQARSVQALAIGLGVTTAVLTSAGLSLIIAGRRRNKKASSLSLLPQAGRDLRGLALIGRF